MSVFMQRLKNKVSQATYKPSKKGGGFSLESFADFFVDEEKKTIEKPENAEKPKSVEEKTVEKPKDTEEKIGNEEKK